MKTVGKQGFTLVELLVVIGILGILSAALYPAITSAVMSANMTAVGARGRDIYVGIIAANTEREPLGLGNIWPKTNGSGAKTDDIADQQFNSAIEYFKVLYDEDNVGKTEWNPYVVGFDYSKLAGAGVKTPSGKTLEEANCMWCIAANVRDEIEDVIPILVTRNFDCSLLATTYSGTKSSTPLKLGDKYATPFSSKAFVIIQKGGGIYKASGRYCTLYVIYKGQTFDISLKNTGGTDQPFQYLNPNSKDTPSGS